MLGFFDLEFQMDDINKHKPPLQKLDKVINWEVFRPIFTQSFFKQPDCLGIRYFV
jgi:hypothetical protein